MEGHCRAGLIFELSPSGGTWTETILYNFPDLSDGYPASPTALVMDESGKLYGTATNRIEIVVELLELTPS